MPTRHDISVIIVSFNCLESLKACLESLGSQAGPAFEIIVVDNDSGDGTPAYLEAQKVKSIFPGKNLGYGAAVNCAAAQADGRYLFIINPDTTIPAGAFATLLEFAERTSNCGLISPLLVHPDGKIQLSARAFPRRRDFIVGRGSPLFKLGFTNEKNAGYVLPGADSPVEVPAISATAVFVNAGLFRVLGGFDSRFFMYLEDLDLCRRVSERGLKIRLLPGVKVIHGWRRSSRTRPYFAAYHHHLSVYRYFRKYHPRQWFYNVMLVIALAAGFVVNCVLMALRGRR